MSRQSILVVDDETSIRELLTHILSEFMHVILAKDGEEALEAAQSKNPALILLDISMPGRDGLEVCRLLRQNPETSNIPIIMLTAHNEPEKRIDAFNFGADDFISKPFLPAELVARIKRKLDRALQATSTSNSVRPLQIGNLKLCYENLQLEINGKSHELGQVEYRILGFLLKRKGQLVPREDLNQYVWGSDLPSDRALDPHITSLRKKLEKSNSYLKSVYGKGYSIILKDSGV